MKLTELQGSYDSIFSLGRRCLTAMHLEENKLRSGAGVFDWLFAPELSSVNHLIKTRFHRFMDYDNLRIIGKTNHSYIVYDEYSHIYSYHDFPLSCNSAHHLRTYLDFRRKLVDRIHRFNNQLEQGGLFLFIRIQGLLRDATELERVLAERVSGDFRVLIVNEGICDDIVEIDWGLTKTCVIEIPHTDVHPFVNAHHWTRILEGVKLAI